MELFSKRTHTAKHNDIRWRICNQQIHSAASKERTPNCATKHQLYRPQHSNPDVSLTQPQTSGTWLNILNMNSSFDLSHETLNSRHNKKGKEHNPLALLITKPYELWLNCSQRKISRQIRRRRAPIHLTVMCYVTIKAWTCFSCWKVKYIQLVCVSLPVLLFSGRHHHVWLIRTSDRSSHECADARCRLLSQLRNNE